MIVTGDVETGAEQRNRAELADLLRQEIDSGKYPVGTKLPSYRQLAEMFGAAPNTVGEAVRMLAAEGRVKVKPNAGAVVADPDDQPKTPEQQLQEARAGLVEVREQLRSVRRDVDALDSRVADLIAGLPAD
ncbi:GntR family transcriptional regulator, uxuAB operon transcriptional repressor [Lentzea fradiae]|uniref:GntR family transcriptional regulator, uxuAB operon transcriptional repressor n=1 Tax=Lentzea fradiae TaxID=200378 RepID=A0A1G8A6C6_9PSEU|nr:GntR family transcriptional regulator, uxuAB operon transcriptional repressor [Lentzea fradiae]